MSDDLALGTIDDPSENRSPVTIEQRVLFCEALARSGSFQKAAEVAHPGVKPESAARYFRSLVKKDADFAQEVRKALVRCQSVIETVIFDHAINGVEEDVYHNGLVVGTKVNYDHRLLLAVAKRNARLLGDDSWEEKKVVEHQGGQTVNHKVDVKNLSREDRDRLREARRLAQEKGVIDAKATEIKP